MANGTGVGAFFCASAPHVRDVSRSPFSSSVYSTGNAPWYHRGMHRMRLDGIPGTSDPRIGQELVIRASLAGTARGTAAALE